MQTSQSTEYEGRLIEYQLYSSNYKKKQHIQYERDPYNPYQNFLYKRALFGLSMYTKEEIAEMHWQKRKRIQKVHKRTQSTLNLWKQQIVNEITNSIFSIFHRSSIAKKFVEGSCTDPAFKNTMSFQELRISKEDVIDKLIREGVLPGNFHELKPPITNSNN